MFIVGIDIAKRSHVARIIDSEGQTVVKPFSIRNSCFGYNALLARITKITNHKSEFILAMESTSHYWLALYTRLCREGYRVVLLNPIQTHAMRELLNQNDTKTDEIDNQPCLWHNGACTILRFAYPDRLVSLRSFPSPKYSLLLAFLCLTIP